MSLEEFKARFGTVTESYWFYKDSDCPVEVRFNKEKHEYYLVDPELGNLTLLHSVSAVSHIVDRSVALIPWAAKATIEKLLRIVPSVDGVVSLSLDEFTKLALQAKTAHSDVLDDASDVGHKAHEWIEHEIRCRISGVPNVRSKPEDERARNCCDAALKWMTAHNVRWLETEKKVYSKLYQCSGTMDGLALTDSCEDPTCCQIEFTNHLSLTDWKTSNYLYTEYLYQTAAYEGFYQEEFPDQKIEDRWVIRLGKEDADFDPWYLPGSTYEEDFNGFLACLALKRIVISVEERMKIHKRTIRELKKESRNLEKNKQLMVKCKNADKYQGIRKPRCNSGHPCETCVKTYEDRQKEKNEH
jgi:hypothetical protein